MLRASLSCFFEAAELCFSLYAFVIEKLLMMKMLTGEELLAVVFAVVVMVH